MRPVYDSSLGSLAAEFEKLSELIENGLYDEAAEFLEQARISREQNGADALIELFGAARQICLACGQPRAERAAPRRAEGTAGGGERELRNQLQALPKRWGGNDPGEPPPKSNAPESAPSPNSKSSTEPAGAAT